jgi:hypothetical protein
MKCVRRVACMEIRNSYKILVQKPEQKRPSGVSTINYGKGVMLRLVENMIHE